MQQRGPLAFLTLASLAGLGSAQESKALFDAPVVVVDSLNRIEHLAELDGTPGPEALSWWWTNKQYDTFAVRAFDIDPQAGFLQSWEMTLDNPNAPALGGYVSLASAAFEPGANPHDLVVANNDTLRFFVGSRSFAPTLNQTHTLTNNRRFIDVQAADLDGDGDDDVVALQFTGDVMLFKNGGAANNYTFTLEQTFDLGAIQSRLRLAELTGDDTPDLFFARGNAIVIQPVDPDFTFPAEINYPMTGMGTPLPVPGDIDGDGDMDGVVFHNTAGTWVYTVLRRQGPSTLVQEGAAVGGPATDFVDLDGDGDLDGTCCSSGGGISSQFKWHNRNPSTFELCHNDGTGAFTPAFPLRGLGASKFAGAADLDFDGDVDLVAGRVVYYAPAPITGPFELGLTSGEHHARVLRDWDDDGDPDLCVGYEEFKQADGHGHFDAMAPEMKPLTVAGLAFKGPGYTGDFDGDGDDDLLVAKYKDGTFRKMRVLENVGGGKLIDGWDASGPGVSFSKTGNDYIDPRGGYAVDYDQDGDDDLFTWDPDSTVPNGTLWENDGTGFFTASTKVDMTNHRPQGMADFDGDGIKDIVTTKYGGRVYIRRLNASGGIKTVSVAHPTAEVEGNLGSVAIGDFDNDGDKDLIVNDQYYYNNFDVLMLVNTGNASFTQLALGVGGPFYGQPAGLALTTDVNGDGWSDVITSNPDQARSAAVILLRNPDGVLFQPPIEQILRPYHAKDLDGDGDPDLIDGSFHADPLRDDRVVKNRRVEGAGSGWRKQIGSGVAGTHGYTPTLGARMFGGYAKGDSIKFLLTGAAPGATGRFIVDELGTTAAPSYTVTPGTWGSLPSDGDVTHQFAQVIDFVTSGLPTDPPGSGKWDTRNVIKGFYAGRTFRYRVEIDDPGAPGGLAETAELYVRYADLP